jgi:hypothetical protein
VGVYYANSNTWAGSVTWNFDLSGVNLAGIQSARVSITRPSQYGKGLHSTGQTGQGIVRVSNNELSRLTTNVAQCGSNDWYAHTCSTTVFSYDIPVSYLTSSTPVQVETTSKTAWDVNKVTLTLTGS